VSDVLYKILDGRTPTVAITDYRYPIGQWTRHIDEPLRRCAACPRKVDVLVSTTGRRWVCLACAHNITRAAEQRAVLEEAS